jgi:hypothetical protein
MDKLDLSKAVLEEQQANLAGISHRTLKGLPTSIDPDRPPRNYKDAMSRDDRQNGQRHTIRNIVDSKNEMHSRSYVPSQVSRFMTL